jgi:hypothetical protein
LSLDMAKELSMVEHTDKGRAAQRYFIEMERIAQRQVPPRPLPPAHPPLTAQDALPDEGPQALLSTLMDRALPIGSAGRQLTIRTLIEIIKGYRQSTCPKPAEARELLGR